MCSKQHWQNQFRCCSFGLEYPTPRHFITFEFGWPKVYLFWRGLMAIYHTAMIILTGFLNLEIWIRTEADRVKWFVYLTHWAFFVLTLSNVYEFLAICASYVCCGKKIRDDTFKMPIFLKVAWVFNNVAMNGSLLITILFWALLYTPGAYVAPIDMITHIGNSLFVLVNLFLVAAPVRFYHFFHTVIFAAIYIIFTVVYFELGGTNGLGYSSIYSVLDWANPGTAAMYSCLCSLVGVPVIQFILMLLVMLRVTLFDLCLSRKSSADL